MRKFTSTIDQICFDLDESKALFYERSQSFWAGSCQCGKSPCDDSPPPALILKSPNLKTAFLLTRLEITLKDAVLELFDLAPIDTSDAIRVVDLNHRVLEKWGGEQFNRGPSFLEICGEGREEFLKNPSALRKAAGWDFELDVTRLLTPMSHRIVAYLVNFENDLNQQLAAAKEFQARVEAIHRSDLANPL